MGAKLRRERFLYQIAPTSGLARLGGNLIPDDIPVKRVACCDLATGCGPEVVKKAGLFSFLVRGQGFQIGLDSSLVTRHPLGRQALCARRGAEREEVERQ